MKTVPKYLVELDWESPCEWMRPLWVARTRNPWCMARITERDDGAIAVELWPPIIDGLSKNGEAPLASKMTHALLRAYDMYPGEFTEPEVMPGVTEPPPEFVWMTRAESEAEFILDPHAPRLWRVQVTRSQDTSGVTWWQGFGIPTESLNDARRVTDFIHQSETL